MARPPRWDRGEWDTATVMLLGRDGSDCSWCGKGLRGDAHRHHRMRRKEGGDRLENLVLVHGACHAELHSQVWEARRRGFVVPTWSDPLAWPVHLRGIAWSWLNAEGTRSPLVQAEVDAWLGGEAWL